MTGASAYWEKGLEKLSSFHVQYSSPPVRRMTLSLAPLPKLAEELGVTVHLELKAKKALIYPCRRATFRGVIVNPSPPIYIMNESLVIF
jgi:hypothetical protein